MSAHGVSLYMFTAISKSHHCTRKTGFANKLNLVSNKVIRCAIRITERTGNVTKHFLQHFPTTQNFVSGLLAAYSCEGWMGDSVPSYFQPLSLHLFQLIPCNGLEPLGRALRQFNLPGASHTRQTLELFCVIRH